MNGRVNHVQPVTPSHCTSNQRVRLDSIDSKNCHVLHRLKNLYPSSGIWCTSGRFKESGDGNTVYTLDT